MSFAPVASIWRRHRRGFRKPGGSLPTLGRRLEQSCGDATNPWMPDGSEGSGALAGDDDEVVAGGPVAPVGGHVGLNAEGDELGAQRGPAPIGEERVAGSEQRTVVVGHQVDERLG